MKVKISILIICFIIPAFFNAKSQTLNQQDSADFMNIMHRNMDQIGSFDLTGDPDYDFIRLIQLHHRGGIRMTEEQIKKGSDESAIDLARDIKNRLERDLQELQQYLFREGESDEEFLHEMMSNIEESNAEMTGKMTVNSDSDRNFITMMSMHQEQSIKMADIAVRYTRDPKVRRFALKVLDQQEKDKAQLEVLNR